MKKLTKRQKMLLTTPGFKLHEMIEAGEVTKREKFWLMMYSIKQSLNRSKK